MYCSKFVGLWVERPKEVWTEASGVCRAALSIVWTANKSSGVKLTLLFRRHCLDGLVLVVKLVSVDACACNSIHTQLLYPIQARAWPVQGVMVWRLLHKMAPRQLRGRRKCESALWRYNDLTGGTTYALCLLRKLAGALSDSLSHTHSRSLSGVGWVVQRCTNGMMLIKKRPDLELSGSPSRGHKTSTMTSHTFHTTSKESPVKIFTWYKRL